jgi:ABC-2 type transport system permease protein
MYLLGAFSGMGGDVKLELITPFKHFDANAIIRTGAYDLPLVMISVAVILIALAGSYWRYLHRDIPAVA